MKKENFEEKRRRRNAYKRKRRRKDKPIWVLCESKKEKEKEKVETLMTRPQTKVELALVENLENKFIMRYIPQILMIKETRETPFSILLAVKGFSVLVLSKERKKVPEREREEEEEEEKQLNMLQEMLTW